MTETTMEWVGVADFRGNRPLGERDHAPLNLAGIEAMLHQGKRIDPQLVGDVAEVYGDASAEFVEEFSDVCADCGLHFWNPEDDAICEVCDARHGFALTPQAMEQLGAWSPREV